MLGETPPIASSSTWLAALALAPWPTARLLAIFVPSLDRREAALVAYNLAAIAPNVYMSAVGCRAWWFDEALAAAWAESGHARLYTPLALSASMISCCMAYELWNTLMAIALPEYRTAAFVGHHATTLYLALLSTAPFLHVYGAYFVGVTAVSSVLLGVVDIFRHVTALQQALPSLNLALRACFALAFLATRTVMWPLVSVPFWRDVVAALRDGSAHSAWACAVYLAANVLLTALQALWSVRIARGLWTAVVGAPTKGA